MISEFEIARAKEGGAVGVTLVLALIGAERCAELATFCKKIGACLPPLVPGFFFILKFEYFEFSTVFFNVQALTFCMYS